MKTITLLLLAVLAAGCTSTGHGSRDNHEYARNCGYAMDALLLCGERP
ncbi:hypothetical protein LB543_05095 [Mesorhizobium sp. ESP7-2]|nr:hypothetical protein [Mesorhizobium sp. ESP7-2]MBZ9706095.1 hypothetical protein [Mesorhizobium sp. ESP7-2]